MKKIILFIILFIQAYHSGAQCWRSMTAAHHSVAIRTDGTLWSWGRNNYGGLGNGNYLDSPVPEQIGTDNDWKMVSMGQVFVTAIRNDGSLWAWGQNNQSQVGDGTVANKNVPVHIGTDTDWAFVSSGGSHTIALKTNGTLWAWGSSFHGQCGTGPIALNASVSVPTQVGTDNDWKFIAGTHEQSLAIKNNGTLWTWGENLYGQLGNGLWGNNLDVYYPTQIGNDTDWAYVAGNLNSSFALKSNGTLWAWGANDYGQLGNGTVSQMPTLVPTQVGTDTDWLQIEAAFINVLALKTDHTLWTWGSNSFGQLGDGTFIDKNTPAQVAIGSHFKAIAAGTNHSVVIRDDNTLLTFGRNTQYELGNGTLTNSSTMLAIGICDPFHEEQSRIENFKGGSIEALNYSPTLVNDKVVTAQVTLYPDPAINKLNIDLPQDVKVQMLCVYTVAGHLIKKQSNAAAIDVSSFSKGLYLIEVQTNKGVLRAKFTKE
jgi:alpha-tubulin suppressor-like RCC1 family protein